MTKEVIFMRRVSEMKAWELYTGQSIWFFVVGIAFYLLKYLLDMTFLRSSPRFQSAYKVVETVGSGQASPDDGAKFASRFVGS